MGSLAKIDMQSTFADAKPGLSSVLPDQVLHIPLVFHVPDMHCAGCIGKIERHLMGMEGVITARVNFSRKQVTVQVNADLGYKTLQRSLENIGFKADRLDPEVLVSSDDDKLAKQYLLRIAVAGFGMMNVMLLSVAVWSGADKQTAQLLHLISALIAIPVLIFSARPFFDNAYEALSHFRVNMDVPISLAILLATLNSFYETMNAGQHAYFDAALALTFFLLGGRYLDLVVRRKAFSAAAHLAKLDSEKAMRLVDEEMREVDVTSLETGDIVVIAAGEKVPCDGVVLDGESESDRSFLTGESRPFTLMKHVAVYGGELNLTGQITVEITRKNSESTLNKFIDLVEAAEASDHRFVSLAERAARIYVPLVHTLALASFICWMALSGDFRFSLNTAIAVLIITCPCALGLAVPAVITVASGQAFARGVLLKTSTALERLTEIDTIVFDKTGTLTTGELQLKCLDGLSDEEQAILYSLAKASRHPFSQAIASLGQDKLTGISLNKIKEIPGKGIEAEYDGKLIRLGRAGWAGKETSQSDLEERFIIFNAGNGIEHKLFFSEQHLPGISELLKGLDEAGYKRILLTGDGEYAARKMADELGFATFENSMTPENKIEYIKALQDKGSKVAMIGDGLNDTAALAQADISVAPSSAMDAARSAADIILLGDRLLNLDQLLVFAKTVKRRIVQNFLIAALYNMIAVPVAFIGLATPLVAAIAMSTSSITVCLNAVRLKLIQHREIKT